MHVRDSGRRAARHRQFAFARDNNGRRVVRFQNSVDLRGAAARRRHVYDAGNRVPHILGDYGRGHARNVFRDWREKAQTPARAAARPRGDYGDYKEI